MNQISEKLCSPTHVYIVAENRLLLRVSGDVYS